VKRKRLKNIVDTMCHIFCGWETYSDYNELIKLGNGTIKVNILNEECYFDDSKINMLNVAKGLINWFKKDCKNNNIDIALIKNALLTVELNYNLIDSKNRFHSRGEIFYNNGKNVNSSKFHKCEFRCKGHIETDEKKYKSDYVKYKEWPNGWPK